MTVNHNSTEYWRFRDDKGMVPRLEAPQGTKTFPHITTHNPPVTRAMEFRYKQSREETGSAYRRR